MKVSLNKPDTEKRSTLRRVLRAGRKPALVAAILGGLAYGGWILWNNVRSEVAIGPEYQFDPKDIDLPPLPGWIHTDIKTQVIRDAGWGSSLSLLDERLTVRVAQAFQLNPWVAKVTRVSKKQPPGVQVDLEFRRPVAMVEVSGGLLAVDAEGTVLPSDDFTAADAQQYPRITGIQTGPRGPVGTKWGDPGVTAGAQLAAYLRESWGTLQLKKIIPQVATPTDLPERLNFSLVTRGDRVLTWGHLPGREITGELPAPEKLSRLKRHVEESGSLDNGDPPLNSSTPPPRRTATLPRAKHE